MIGYALFIGCWLAAACYLFTTGHPVAGSFCIAIPALSRFSQKSKDAGSSGTGE